MLLKWKSLPLYEATWEDFSLVSTKFPEFHLEDKVRKFGRGIMLDPKSSSHIQDIRVRVIKEIQIKRGTLGVIFLLWRVGFSVGEFYAVLFSV